MTLKLLTYTSYSFYTHVLSHFKVAVGTLLRLEFLLVWPNFQNLVQSLMKISYHEYLGYGYAK